MIALLLAAALTVSAPPPETSGCHTQAECDAQATAAITAHTGTMLGLGALDTVQVALDQARVAVADWHIERGLPVVTDGTGQFVEHITEDHPLWDCATMGNRECGVTA